jgi:hypothetical protein
VFGYITDGLLVGQVDSCDVMGSEENAIVAVAVERADGEAGGTTPGADQSNW